MIEQSETQHEFDYLPLDETPLQIKDRKVAFKLDYIQYLH